MKNEIKVIDANAAPIARQNWDVCHRMLIHDLIDLSISNRTIRDLLEFYRIQYHESGGYTMDLPRQMAFNVHHCACKIKKGNKKQLKIKK